MRFGYWLPVFGGWLRNVEDEDGMSATWEYASRLARRSEALGFDLTLVAELNLNDIKGIWSSRTRAWISCCCSSVRSTRRWSGSPPK